MRFKKKYLQDSLRNKERASKANKNNDLFRDKAIREEDLTLSIPICPSVNHMYIFKKTGEKILTKTAREYFKSATAKVNEQISNQSWQIDYGDVWYYVDVYVYMPDRKVRDSHNMIKIMMDVLQDTVFWNDYFAMPRFQDVKLDKDNPRIDIVIKAKD